MGVARRRELDWARGSVTTEDDPPRRDATATPATIEVRAVVSPVQVRIKSHFWIDWAEIAIQNEAAARGAREEIAPEDPSKGLQAEKHAGMIAVSASAHALDALYGELRDRVPLPDWLRAAWAKKKAETGRGSPRHSVIVETLKLGFTLGKAAADWPARFEWLFDLRDAAVHFEEDFHEPVPHPLGTSTAVSDVSYSLESAERAVDVVLEVLTTCVASPRSKLPFVVKWAGDMGPAVQRLTSMRQDLHD
jgi:hypothetical protein